MPSRTLSRCAKNASQASDGDAMSDASVPRSISPSLETAPAIISAASRSSAMEARISSARADSLRFWALSRSREQYSSTLDREIAISPSSRKKPSGRIYPRRFTAAWNAALSGSSNSRAAENRAAFKPGEKSASVTKRETAGLVSGHSSRQPMMDASAFSGRWYSAIEHSDLLPILANNKPSALGALGLLRAR